MSKRQKRNVLQLFENVKEGLRQLPDAREEEVLQILQVMQEAVISVGDIVEKCTENYDKAVVLLTDLAELIYQLSLDNNYANAQRQEEVEQLCDDARCEVEAIFPTAYEVLFLPYKVSMWDALESVYAEAKKAQNCSVRVMPVPYYHVTEDRTDLIMEYEGDLFPEEMEITDYREYEIADIQPDVIFIHNPYDDKNRVTSLAERYFSSELKKYTDRLVYIPYKVCIDKVSDFYCVMPGVKNAWRVFVQSEQVRDVYLKYNVSDKIITTGSPKIDKIVHNEACKPEMPNEWKHVLGGRKIFLLNTHLSNIINDSDSMIRGLQQVIAAFEGRNKAAILWRPHPLSIETAKAMNPDVLESYLETIKQFKQLDNGLYDETPDPHLAIALADAYIGDWSSLVTMFGVTGKPVYIRDFTVREKCKLEYGKTINVQEKLVEASGDRRLATAYYEDIICLEDYVDMMLNGEDILASERKKEFANLVYNTQGTVGKHIWKYVENDLRCETEECLYSAIHSV